MRRRNWESGLRRALLAFRKSSEDPSGMKIKDFAEVGKCTVQHAYRLLEGYDSAPSDYNRIGRKAGLLDFGWIERTPATGPRKYRLTEIGRREMLKAARTEREIGATPPLSRRRRYKRRKMPDELGMSGPLVPKDLSNLTADIRRRIKIARRYELRGQHRDSLAVYEAILSEKEVQDSENLKIWLMLRLAAIHYLDRRLDLSAELIFQAEKELGEEGTPWLKGWLLVGQGTLLNAEGSGDEAMDKLLEAEKIARETGDMYLLRLVLHNQGEAHLTCNEFPELGYEKFEEALAVADNEDDQRGISYEKWNLGRYLIDWGFAQPKDRRKELERARELAKESAQIAERVKNYHYAALAHVIMGEAEEALGRLDDDFKPRGRAAVKTYKKVLKLGFMLEDNRLVANAATHLANAHYRLGQVTKAEETMVRLNQIATLPTLRVVEQWWRDGRPVLRTSD
ncbi:MAG: hypothetical protein KAR39_03000 [Thermoplasmata archaeon]|nr:hypothetical protein [Thermoplasmata archaeon]